jgi:hypothetical protein
MIEGTMRFTRCHRRVCFKRTPSTLCVDLASTQVRIDLELLYTVVTKLAEN